MPAKAQSKPNPDFELRAMAWLQVKGEDFVPVFIYVGVGVFGQSGQRESDAWARSAADCGRPHLSDCDCRHGGHLG